MLTTALVAAVLMQGPEVPAQSPAPVPFESVPTLVPQWTNSGVGGSKFGFENFFPRFGVQHRSQGYGYDSGFTSFDTFVPIYQQDFSWLTAFQGNVIVDNYGDFGLNAGMVQRKYLDSWERVVGVNSFYTHRQQGGNSFNQMGFGVETLGNYLDWRLNGYFPFGDDFQIPTSGGGVTSAEFSGRNILVNFIADKPLTGFDTEIGGIIPSSLDIFRAYVGFYHFGGDYSEDANGVQGRLEARLQDMGVLSVAVTNDGVFGTNVVLAAGFYFPGTAPRNQPYSRAAGRMAEDVIRNYNVTIDRSSTTDPVVALDTNGQVIDVVHIDSTAAGLQDGSLLNPVTTLTDAAATGQPGSILFAHANSTFVGEGIVLQDGQQLLGEGVSHTVQSLYGSFILPTVTPPEDVQDVPLIQSAPGNAVTLANNSAVSGFRIFDAGGNGVYADSVTNVRADRLGIRSADGNGIEMTNVSGNIAANENFVLIGPGRGISISTSSADTQNTLVVSDNTVIQNTQEGIVIATNGESANTLVMERNYVRVSLGPLDTRSLPLVQLTTNDSSTVNARIEDNDIEDSFARDDSSPDDDPYYHQFVVSAFNNSRVDIAFVNNRFTTDRQPLANNPANGSFGLNLQSSDVSLLRARLDSNTSSLNYAFNENYISRMQIEDTLTTNSGQFFYFPTENFIETLPVGTISVP